jgi:hypothetical protein
MFSLSAVLDPAQVSRVLGDLQVTVRVECDTSIGASETRRRRVVALITKRLVTWTQTAIYDTVYLMIPMLIYAK